MANIYADLHRLRVPKRDFGITAQIAETAFTNMLKAVIITDSFPFIVGSQFVAQTQDEHWDDIVVVLRTDVGAGAEFIEIGYDNRVELVRKDLFLKRLKRLKYMLVLLHNSDFTAPATTAGDFTFNQSIP